MKRALLALLPILAACAAPRPVDPAVELKARGPLICHGATRCDEMWKRAQFWVSGHSGYKIQTATDTVISTFNPPDYSLSWGFTLRKEPLGNGDERIWITPTCGRAPICRESPFDMVVQAKDYIGWTAASMQVELRPPVPAPVVPTTSKYAAPAETAARAENCIAKGAPELIGSADGRETVLVRCTPGTAVLIKCDARGCQALR